MQSAWEGTLYKISPPPIKILHLCPSQANSSLAHDVYECMQKVYSPLQALNLSFTSTYVVKVEGKTNNMHGIYMLHFILCS